MNFIMLILIVLMAISSLMLLLNIFISKKSFKDQEKSSPFECGFDPISLNHLPFSIQFFLISLIFLVFDIELTILIPLTILSSLKFNLAMIICSAMFFLLLILGLYLEYNENSIDWNL
uniref:NADH dehydrogenase subunit 3 n=1 Tax=Pheidole flavigaster TaxID=3045141 RepID=UPI00257C2E8E|nr:NADH dehydrogenase subunit 3 [Pheidole flavigaster]WGV34158.1 NADH dehydrogenase subunit 3 [Pheidole flavigaster]